VRRRWFRMLDNVHVPGRWYLTDPTDIHGHDLWFAFVRGKRVPVEGAVTLKFNKHAPRGRRVDYSELSGESTPVVHVRVAEKLIEVAPSDVQIVPVSIPGEPDEFCLVNVVKVVKCINDEESRYEYRDEDDSYRIMTTLRIDPARVQGTKIFRPLGWEVAIVVAEEVKEALEQLGVVGVKFQDCTAGA